VYQSENYFWAIERAIRTTIATCGQVFPDREVEKRIFPLQNQTAYITVQCATEFGLWSLLEKW